MIKIMQVTKKYAKEIKAVDTLDLEIRDGEIFGFIGPNGAGKTTTIKMMTGITDFDEGQIYINDYDIRRQALAAKKEFGYVPDSPDMFLRLKGIEYLNFMANIYDVPTDMRQTRIQDLAEKFEMRGALADKIQSYSHGMRQKIVLMGALLHNPKHWILDEPMTGLDPKSSFLLKQMMKEHANQGNSVFFSTHVLEVAEKLCDRIGIINRGKLVYCGTMQDLKSRFAADASLETIFLEMTKHV
jgi:ABC-2 type transport system ATP-binding protein